MNRVRDDLLDLLYGVARGKLSVEAAARRLSSSTFVDMDGVTVDLGRRERTGSPEVIYTEGKDEEHLQSLSKLYLQRRESVLFTRVGPEQALFLEKALPGGRHSKKARIYRWPDPLPADDGEASTTSAEGLVIISAGASDAGVAEEVFETAAFLGISAELISDCGVAGLHRLLSVRDILDRALVVVAVAGMDGVLPTVVAGLVAAPVIAVPTSVGYGPGAGGLTPLLAMLASCAPGLTVVNVDNGVGAAFAAARVILHSFREAR